MLHDRLCELDKWRPICPVNGCLVYLSAHCHCGSRSAPYCDGCGTGQHLKHDPNVECICDLCEEAA